MAVSLHPDNPHYLLFRGKPAVLITSGEHYGAVLNSQFDYVTYLDELKANDFNLTRIFTGLYTESPESFSSGIAGNTLAPAPGKLLCPWARIPNAGNKFDLKKWDEAYFSRLQDFVAEAGSRGIVVEVSLFCTYYEEEIWVRSPFKACNNTAGVGKVPRQEVYTLKHPALLAVQQAMVRKIVSHLA
ncbi:MAG: hypothetical protein QF662_02785, partial [Phycisphaerae bacterium]|nr:hypothetical protein [Phycisphaerae bacterium]